MAPEAIGFGRVTELTVIQREIDRARSDLESAVQDLEAAARRYVEPEHWKRALRDAALRTWTRRPGTVLATAFVTGFLLGRPGRRRR